MGEKPITRPILIRGARQLLTLHGSKTPRRGAELNELAVIQDGSLLIENGILKEVNMTRRVENLKSAREAIEINAAGRVVMPGFVDSHTHLTLPRNTGTAESQRAPLVRSRTGKRLAREAKARLQMMAQHGTTTIEATTECGADESAETKLLRVIAALERDPLELVGAYLFRPPAAGGASLSEWVIRKLLPKIRKQRLATFADLAWRPEQKRLCVSYLKAAGELGFARKMHADTATLGQAISLAMEYPVVSVDHFEHGTAADAAALSRTGAMATLAANRALDCAAPTRELIERGVPIALATDYQANHRPSLNMQAAVALACLNMRMTVEEAISAATINGAHALGRADRLGSLEIGKSADVLVLNAPDYRELACNLGANLVHMTIKDGEVIYREGPVGSQFCGTA